MSSNRTIRLIDAAANRAREALRVMEDAARFLLDDRPLTDALKTLRHDLRAALDALPFDDAQRLAWRDTPGDVGTDVVTEAEGRRATVADVVAAAGARLSEALRSIEEYAKLTSPDVAARVERIRYEAYDVERRVVLAARGGRSPQWRLCVLVTESLCTHHDWETVVRLAIDGGADCIQLREKSLDGGELARRARRLVELTRPGGVASVINDRPDIALLAGADGVHLGQSDLTVRDVRKLAGERLLVGVSTSSLDEARRAASDSADGVGAGPMFPTTTKAKDRIAGPDLIRAYEAADPPVLPYLAIGGITPENVGELRAVGCRGIAVSSAVCGASDPAGACAALLEGLGS